MADHDAFDLTDGTDLETRQLSGPPDRRGTFPVGLVVALLLLVGAATGLYFWLRPSPEEAAVEPPAVATTPAPQATAQTHQPAVDDRPLPPLEGSDAFVRGLVGVLSQHPALASWLTHEDLVRRFVVSIDNVAEGVAPRKHLLFMGPRDGFSVTPEGAGARIDPKSYRRYSTLVAAFVGLDTAGCGKLLDRLDPLLEDAYKDLGYPHGGFRTTLVKAIDHLLATPELRTEPLLRPQVTTYAYADPLLENLTAAQKQLLRLGPENGRQVRAKLAELRRALGQR